MQTTLLGLAGAIILALLAALIGPFLIDWTRFRPVIEAQASRMAGLPVRIDGAIEARLLPAPSLRLRDLRIGAGQDEQALRLREVSVEFSLGALARAELRAAEAQVIGPQLDVRLDRAGALELPKFAVGFNPEMVAIERLLIEDGRLHVLDTASGNRLTLDHLWFAGDLRSLVGPLKGEGAFVTGGELYGYRISAGRLGDDGTMRLRLSLDPSDRPLTAEVDGTLMLAGSEPRFEGAVTLSRPAALVAATGQSEVAPPWRLAARVRANAAAARFQQLDVQYGAEEWGMRLAGSAELRFGRHGALKCVLSAPQIDLDRLIATREAPRRPPAEALRLLLQRYASAMAVPLPAEFSVSADTVLLGGAPLHMVGADLRLAGGVLSLDRLELRAPGLTQVQASGRLETAAGLGFSGPVGVETQEPAALAAWLEGRAEAAGSLRPIKFRGDVVLNQNELAVERLQAEIDRRPVTGRLHYRWASGEAPAGLDAELSAPELDLDSLLALSSAARASLTFEPPRLMRVALDIGRARIAGIDARAVRAKVRREPELLHVEHLAVEDLGGAGLTAQGRLDLTGAAPRGTLSFDLAARELEGLTAVLARYAPDLAGPLQRTNSRLSPAQLQATLVLDGPVQAAAGVAHTARFSLEGTLGGLRAGLRGQMRGDSAVLATEGLAALGAADIRVDGQVDGEDGRVLIALLGLDGLLGVDRRPGFVSFLASGRPEAMAVEARLLAGGLDGRVKGTAQLGGAQGRSAQLTLALARADLAPLRERFGGSGPLPLRLDGRLTVTGETLRLENASAMLAGSDVRGWLEYALGEAPRIAGEIEADTLDAAALIGAALGLRPVGTGRNDGWSAEPFGSGLVPHFTGTVAVRALQAALTGDLAARQLQARLGFAPGEIRLETMSAHLAGGQLAGDVALRRNPHGIALRATLALAGLDAAAVLPQLARPAIGGRLSAEMSLEAAGMSPRALIGSLAGSGTVTLEDGYVSALDPRAFDTIIRAADQGLVKDVPRIREIVAAALDSGRFAVSRIDATLAVSAGQARLASAAAPGTGADLTVTATLDLVQEAIDARLVLAGREREDGPPGRPELFIAVRGPIARPERQIDVTALSGWLTLRAIDQQARKLEALEAAARREAGAAPPAAPASEAPRPVGRAVPPPLAGRGSEASGRAPRAAPEGAPRPNLARPLPVAPAEPSRADSPGRAMPAPVPDAATSPAAAPLLLPDLPLLAPEVAGRSPESPRSPRARSPVAPPQVAPALEPPARALAPGGILAPEPGRAAAVPAEAAPDALLRSQAELAPPLPEPIEVRRLPGSGSAGDAAVGAPLVLPSLRPPPR